MNTAKREAREVFGGRGDAPLRWQDKKGELRLSAASGQPLWLPKTALNTQPHTKSPHNTVHSTKRKTVFAGSWIDGDTDAYIQIRSYSLPRKSDRIPPPVRLLQPKVRPMNKRPTLTKLATLLRFAEGDVPPHLQSLRSLQAGPLRTPLPLRSTGRPAKRRSAPEERSRRPVSPEEQEGKGVGLCP